MKSAAQSHSWILLAAAFDFQFAKSIPQGRSPKSLAKMNFE
jgi:hypothetical protein